MRISGKNIGWIEIFDKNIGMIEHSIKIEISARQKYQIRRQEKGQ